MARLNNQEPSLQRLPITTHLHQERLNPVMVLLLGNRSRYRGPFGQTKALPEGRHQGLHLGSGEPADRGVNPLDLGWS